jgi:hypothetical protein
MLVQGKKVLTLWTWLLWGYRTLVLNISEGLSCPGSGSNSDFEDTRHIASGLIKLSVPEDAGGGDLEEE